MLTLIFVTSIFAFYREKLYVIYTPFNYFQAINNSDLPHVTLTFDFISLFWSILQYNISYSLIRKRTYAYQGVRNVILYNA